MHRSCTAHPCGCISYGILYSYFSGNASIISLMKTAGVSRTYALHHPDPVTGDAFLDWPTLTSDRFMFMSSAEYTMSRKLYNCSIPKWPLDARFSLGNVGNSSVSYVVEFFVHGEDTAPLWKCVTQSVSIDMATRKPSPLPDWFKDKYKGKGCMDTGFIIRGFDRPSITYNHQLQVMSHFFIFFIFFICLFNVMKKVHAIPDWVDIEEQLYQSLVSQGTLVFMLLLSSSLEDEFWDSLVWSHNIYVIWSLERAMCNEASQV